MIDAFHTLNYLRLIGVALVGFGFGSLWYSLLFGNAWMAEMKIEPAEPRPPMAPLMIRGFLYTLVSTWGLALVIVSHGTDTWYRGALLGAAVGLLIVGARKLNSGVWERTSSRLMAINVGHEVALFALQGALLAVWH